MTTDISEKGLETLIMEAMTGEDGFFLESAGAAKETPDELVAKKAKGSGWIAGNPKEFDRAHAIDVPQLFQFLRATEPDALKKLGTADYADSRDINRQ
jgi:type I restriction enzyme, R subunit